MRFARAVNETCTSERTAGRSDSDIERIHAYPGRHGLPDRATTKALRYQVSHLDALTLPIARTAELQPGATLCNAASLRPRFPSAAPQPPHTRALRDAYALPPARVQRLALLDSRMHHACSLEVGHWHHETLPTPEQVGGRPLARVMPRSNAFAICKHESGAAHETLPTLYASVLTANLTSLSHVQEALP